MLLHCTLPCYLAELGMVGGETVDLLAYGAAAVGVLPALLGVADLSLHLMAACLPAPVNTVIQ